MDYQKLLEILQNKLMKWGEATIDVIPSLLLAIVVVAIFIVLASIAKRIFKKATKHVIDSEALHKLLASIVKSTVVLTGFFIALSILHLDKAVTSFLAGAGIIGLAFGFAFQNTAANFLSGIFMAFRKPFGVNDVIESKGIMGTVTKINLRNTIIETFDGRTVFIPNKDVYEDVLINYQSLGRRRLDIPIGVTYDTPLQKAEEIALEAASKVEGVIDDKTELFYQQFGDSSIDFDLRIWIYYPNPRILAIKSEVIKAVKKAFDKADITIPFPIRTLDVDDKIIQSIKS